ncbi:MAG: rhodanese-like domain-containing protein [Tannerellaceae bacterium]|jgi:rhodanese-related sulfurtransferase|nr:rhodanese-like domain-containing protein [Tannerellaceae bacterium]
MENFFSRLFKRTSNEELRSMLHAGGILLDVRSKDEYRNGHAADSLNIPLDTLQSKLAMLDKGKAIITVCASGARSGIAKNMLTGHGFQQVYNGGSWFNFK